MATFALSLLALGALASAGSVTPVAGGSYTISPASFPDLCLVPGGDWDGARLTLADCNSSEDIAWSFDGQSLKSSAYGRCSDVLDGGHWNGNGLQSWTCFDYNTNQMFNPSSGRIQWTNTGMCLDLTDGKGVAGNNIQLWQCFDGNTNQQWSFEEVEEVDECDEPAPSASSAPSATSASAAPAPSNSTVGSEDDGEEDCDDTDDSESAEPTSSAVTPSSTIGGELWAGNGGHGSSSHSSTAAWGSQSTSADWSASSTASADWSASSTSADWSASATSADWSASSSAVPTPSAGPSVNGTADMSGYLQTSGTKVVDAQGNTIQLKGTNLGGWLVWEDWMCGITDNSGNADRFPQMTLESRFGEDQTRELMKVWQDNWLIESDFDVLAGMGFNVLRLPFSYLNFVRTDGSYITDSNGNVDFSRLDWAVQQAKARGMWVIPTYHIWDGQQQRYSTVSEDTPQGQDERNKMADLWTKIATHFAGETAIAGYDAINEPTGSAGNILQRDLYKAIRAGDEKRIIIMESISAAPDSDWTNVMYSMHEYLMMGENDFGYNKWMFSQGPQKDTSLYSSFNIPTYIGEFMASGETLDYMLDQMNQMGVWWSNWAYLAVNMDRWSLYIYSSSMYVDVSSDSFDSLKASWSNMGQKTKSRVADQYASAAGGHAPQTAAKRAEIEVTRSTRDVVYSPRVVSPVEAAPMKRSTPHAGRSRRMFRPIHGSKH